MLLLRIPPFPGSKAGPFSVPIHDEGMPSEANLRKAIGLIRESRAAGTYWGSRPRLPDGPYILVRSRLGRIEPSNDMPTLVWDNVGQKSAFNGSSVFHVSGDCDPWHLLEGAVELIADADDELAVIAAIAGVPVRCLGTGPFKAVSQGMSGLLDVLASSSVASTYVSPFSGKRIELFEAIELCAFWKDLIDSNRPIGAAVGFASWKKPTVRPLLWRGSGDVPFAADATLEGGGRVAIWKSRVSAKQLSDLDRSGAELVEVEDGFIRSIGLGADCVPPLSIVVDPVGIYFDPQQPSALENLLEQGSFPPELVERAGRLRKLIVHSGISKYETGVGRAAAPVGGRRKLLVIGQVEDDRSVQCGGGPVQTNLELLRRVRERNPDVHICYRPHPDVLAGHRAGHISEAQLAGLADEVEQGGSITQSLDAADEVHVNTSLAGFEALLRGKPVTTYGVPFYAGWGLTRDFGEVPSRRTARRSLDELVAATLLLYPRYLDPKTGLPCPAEILALRLAEGTVRKPKGLLVRLRQLQGLWKRRMLELRLRKSK